MDAAISPIGLPLGDPLQVFVQRMFYGFLGSLTLYLATWQNFDAIKDRFTPNRLTFMDTYDFIVVGGGSSGAVVAHRLSENFRVLLLEAGGDPFPMSAVPGFSLFLLNYPELDWMHETVPQKKACFGLTGNKSVLSQGKALGGTSNINFLVQSRGSPLDYAKWAESTNDPEWEYDKVIPFFKRSEDYHGYFDSDFHGKGGPVNISQPPYQGSGDVFINAAKDLGYKRVDLHGPFTEGFDLAYYAISRGRRQGTYQAYLRPIRRRPTLTIGKYANVAKLLFRGEGKEVTGVEYVRHGRRRKAFATKEVILSAGALQSPKLLMLSGIGPADHLKQMGIPMRIESPAVGSNLQDHLGTYLGPFFVNEKLETPVLDRDISHLTLGDYMNRGTGILTSSGAMALGFIASEWAKARGENNWPDIQLLYLGVGTHENWGSDFSHAFNYNYDDARKYFAHSARKNSFMIVVSLARPRSRGTVRLQNGNFLNSLEIDPKYLDDDEDYNVLLSGVKKAVEIVEKSETFKKYEAKFTTEPLPGCEKFALKSDEYWQCYVKRMTVGRGHLGGTCAMGVRESPEAVVDKEFNFLGAERLRVIDASVMPTLPLGGTNLPAMMLGERGAFFIKRAWQVAETKPGNTTDKPPLPVIFTTKRSTTTTTVPPVTVSSTASLSSTTTAATSTAPPSASENQVTDNSSAPNRQLRPVSAALATTSVANSSLGIKYLPPLQCKYGFCGERSETP